MRSCLIKVHYRIENFKVGIAFFKIFHIIIKHLFRCFPVVRRFSAAKYVPELHDNLIEKFFLVRLFDVFVVVGYALVGSLLCGIVLGKCSTENLLIELF